MSRQPTLFSEDVQKDKTRKCRRCLEEKPSSDFTVKQCAGSAPVVARRVCKRCRYDAQKKKMENSEYRKKVVEYQKRWRENNYTAERNRKYRKKYHEKLGEVTVKEKLREHVLWYNHRMTLEDYDLMLQQQGGGCAICGGKNERQRKRSLHVDHCHASGKVRGLLCNNCNTGLGRFLDSSELLLSAICYLQRSQVSSVENSGPTLPEMNKK